MKPRTIPHQLVAEEMREELRGGEVAAGIAAKVIMVALKGCEDKLEAVSMEEQVVTQGNSRHSMEC